MKVSRQRGGSLMTGMGCVTVAGSTPAIVVTCNDITRARLIRLWNPDYKYYWMTEWEGRRVRSRPAAHLRRRGRDAELHAGRGAAAAQPADRQPAGPQARDRGGPS